MNWTPELITNLVLALTGLGGVLVTGLGLWMNQRERASAHRQLIYQKQVEAYTEVLGSVAKVVYAAAGFMVSKAAPLDNEERIQLGVIKEIGVLLVEYYRWILFLPVTVQDAIAEFMEVFNAVTAPDDGASQYDPVLVHSSDPAEELLGAFYKVGIAARRALGVDPLSSDIMHIVGTRDGKKRNKPAEGGTAS